jgi:hypothetical protein
MVVGVEKLDICKKGVILGDRKCLGGPRKSFVGHPDVTQFLDLFPQTSFSTATVSRTHRHIDGTSTLDCHQPIHSICSTIPAIRCCGKLEGEGGRNDHFTDDYGTLPWNRETLHSR